MKRMFSVSLVLLFVFLGCQDNGKKKEIAAKVNNYEVTSEDFKQEFRDSVFANNDTPQSRMEFMENLVNRKIILQDAERKGLHKDKEFLKVIERFWEQSLLKVSLDNKVKEILENISISDEEVKERYDNMLNSGQLDISYKEAYPKVRDEIVKEKREKAFNEWLSDMRKKSHIEINQGMLK